MAILSHPSHTLPGTATAHLIRSQHRRPLRWAVASVTELQKDIVSLTMTYKSWIGTSRGENDAASKGRHKRMLCIDITDESVVKRWVFQGIEVHIAEIDITLLETPILH